VDAHSYDRQHRWANVESLPDYLERIEQGRPPIHECRKLATAEKLEERFFLGLRRRQGVSLSAIHSEFGSAAAARTSVPIQKSCDAGWLESTADRLRLTDRGVLFSNEVFASFLSG